MGLYKTILLYRIFLIKSELNHSTLADYASDKRLKISRIYFLKTKNSTKIQLRYKKRARWVFGTVFRMPLGISTPVRVSQFKTQICSRY